MANYYMTSLECLTNCELLKFIDPKKIIRITDSELIYSNSFVMVFMSRRCPMHDDITLLSNKFPNEVFLASYWDAHGYDGTITSSFRYENGDNKFIGYRPNYTLIDDEFIEKEFGEDVYQRLLSRIRKYLRRLDRTTENLLDGELQCDILEHYYDGSVSSYVTIHAEYENYKLSVDKFRNSELRFHGYKRTSVSEEWQEIADNSSQ